MELLRQKERPVNAHDITEHAILLCHQRYAEIVDVEPELLICAREAIAAVLVENPGTAGQRLWQQLLHMQWAEIRVRMLASGSEGRLLRSNSPFSLIIGITEGEKRRQIWRLAKSELLERPEEHQASG